MATERITIAPRLTRQQVARKLGVTPKTVQNWTAKGLLYRRGPGKAPAVGCISTMTPLRSQGSKRVWG